MLKTLIKKQFYEIFRAYFYDAKKNRSRSKLSTALWFVFFIGIMVLVLGGLFFFLGTVLCDGLVAADMDWLYFLIFGMLSVLLGVFGSVFNTFSGLYHAKDNDLLLSMPIPVRYIMISRLMSVYIMGLMYSAVVIVPPMIVYAFCTPFTPHTLIGCILFIAVISLIDMLLSCLLGWCVAKISSKVKSKSFVRVILALAGIGVYYFFYFRAQELLQDILLNAVAYGNAIKGSAYGLYLFGRIAVGDGVAIAVYLGAAVVLMALVLWLISRTFLKIATASETNGKKLYREKQQKPRSLFRALLIKEFKRFGSSANYMLNCGFSILLLPALGIFALIKGNELFPKLLFALDGDIDFIYALFFLCIALGCAMCDMVVPSVSLEGKHLWISHAFPIPPLTALGAKLTVQLILGEIPALFTALCFCYVLKLPFLEGAAGLLFVLLYVLFISLAGLYFGVTMANVHWNNEMIVVKQSANVAIMLLGGMALPVALGALYYFVGSRFGFAICFSVMAALLAFANTMLLFWLDRRGAKAFAAL